MVVKKEDYYLILSLCLGDGSVQQRRNTKKAVLDIAHKMSNSDYIYFKSQLLKNLNISNNVTIKTKKNGNHQRRLLTKSYDTFYQIKRDLYIDNHKVFKKKWIKNLNALALAILWMDDGCLLHNKKKRKDGQTYIYIMGEIATQSFDYQSNKNIVKWLKKFDIDSYICKNKKNQYFIRINRDNTLKLISIIEKYVNKIPSMTYKINP